MGGRREPEWPCARCWGGRFLMFSSQLRDEPRHPPPVVLVLLFSPFRLLLEPVDAGVLEL